MRLPSRRLLGGLQGWAGGATGGLWGSPCARARMGGAPPPRGSLQEQRESRPLGKASLGPDQAAATIGAIGLFNCVLTFH